MSLWGRQKKERVFLKQKITCEEAFQNLLKSSLSFLGDMIKHELRVARYELRVESLKVRVQIHELRVQTHELRVQNSLNQ